MRASTSKADTDTPTPIPPICPGVKELLRFITEAKQTPGQSQTR